MIAYSMDGVEWNRNKKGWGREDWPKIQVTHKCAPDHREGLEVMVAKEDCLGLLNGISEV